MKDEENVECCRRISVEVFDTTWHTTKIFNMKISLSIDGITWKIDIMGRSIYGFLEINSRGIWKNKVCVRNTGCQTPGTKL